MDKEKVRAAINAFYSAAGVDKKFSGDINERVAEIFGKMLVEVKKCSNAFSWIPSPSGSPATIAWVARNFALSMIDRLRDSNSVTCAKGVIFKWDRELHMAGMGM